MILLTIVIIYPYVHTKSLYEMNSCARGSPANVYEGHPCTITALISDNTKYRFLEVF